MPQPPSLAQKLSQLMSQKTGIDFSAPLADRLRTMTSTPATPQPGGLIPAAKAAYHAAVDPTVTTTPQGAVTQPSLLMKSLGHPTEVTMAQHEVQEAPPAPVVHTIRGLNIPEEELKQARDILFSEISNRKGKKDFEVKNVLNVAINRATSTGKSLLEVLQAPNQFQGYAPHGVVGQNGNVIESQYQKIQAGKLTEPDKKKLAEIDAAINDFTNGNVNDITNGKEFYVHATDGTMWFGKTVAEAKKNALDHEKANGKKQSKFGTRSGMPAKGE